MKSILKTSLLALAASAILSTSGSAALLFQETWNDLEIGESAVSSGRWSMIQGLPTQLIGAQPSNPSGHWIAPVYTSAEGASVLPQIQTLDSFSLTPGGVEMSVQAVFTNNSSQYFRIGLAATNNALHNYWFTIHRTEIQLHKRNGTSTPLKLADYKFTSGEWTLNEAKEFSLRITPGEGSYELSLLLNGVTVISFSDTSALPNFTNGFQLFIATRDNQQGYIGNVTLQSIPEGQSIALVGGGILLVAPFLRRKKVLR